MRRGRLRVPLALVGSALIAAFGLPVPSSASSSTTTAASDNSAVVLTGEGTYDVTAEMLSWQNDLYGNTSSPDINFGYVPQGGPAGLSDLLTGGVNFAISGIPYTTAQLAAANMKPSDIVVAPIMPSAVGFLFNPPPGGFAILSGLTGGYSPPYTGPVKVPADNLIAQMYNYGNTIDQISSSDPFYQYFPYNNGLVPYNQLTWGEWDNPDIIGNWDQDFLSQYAPQNNDNTGDSGDTFLPTHQAPQPSYQAEPSESTYYMQDWASVAAPTMWGLLEKVGDPHPTAANPWVPKAQLQPALSRGIVFQPGLAEALSAMYFNTTSNGLADTGGIEAPTPPGALSQLTTIAKNNSTKYQTPPPGLNYEWIDVQNRNGDWLTPSPASIDAAIDATPAVTPAATTTATANYAAANSVPDAYPLTYVDYFYAPAHGLTVPQTEAMATAIRYLVTDGQNYLAAYNTGQLPSGMVLQALAAANQLEQSNCPSADLILTDKAGPYTPGNLPMLDSLPAQYHCEIPASTPSSPTKSTIPTTPSTLSSSGTSPLGVASSNGSSSSASTGSASEASAGSLSSAGSSSGSTSGSRSSGSTSSGRSSRSKTITDQLASALPFVAASASGQHIDHLVALGLGICLFLIVRRRPVAWLMKVLGG